MEEPYLKVLCLNALTLQRDRFVVDGRGGVLINAFGHVSIVAEKLVAAVFHYVKLGKFGFSLDVLGYVVLLLQSRVFVQDAREREKVWTSGRKAADHLRGECFCARCFESRLFEHCCDHRLGELAQH